MQKSILRSGKSTTSETFNDQDNQILEDRRKEESKIEDVNFFSV